MKNKKIYLETSSISILSALLFIVTGVNSYGQTFEWAKQIGSSGWDEGTSIAVDNNSNVYTIGSFRGTVDFDPGTGSFNLTSVGEEDAFICKLDSTGNLVWAKQYGDSSFVESNAIALDAAGNIYTTGSFSGQVDFNPGAGTFDLTSSNWDRDIFIQKLDEDGNFIWAKQISGISPTPLATPSPTNAYSIAIDAIDNFYLTGYFDGTVDFDPDTSNFNLTVVQATDIFVSKFDTDGNFIWVKQLGGQQGGIGYAIAVDENSNVYTTGTIGGMVDFDPGPGVFNLDLSNPFQTEMYISKLDALGNFVWAKSLGSGSGCAIAVDNNSNVYSSAWNSPFLNKHSSSGNLLWTKELGGINGMSIALDNSGHVYTTGSCYGTNDFDPGPGVFNLTGGANGDAFISKLDTSGSFIWAGLFIATSHVTANAIAIDANDNVYATGFFDGTVDFDPAAPIFNLTTPATSYNIFVQKLAVPNVSLGLLESNFEGGLQAYPNPTDGKLVIEFERDHSVLNLVLRTMTGKVVDTKSVTNTNQAEMEINEPSGIYFLEISNQNDQKTMVKVIKK